MLKCFQKTKKEWYKFICNNILIVIGSVVLAFGTAIFLTKNFIVSGGVGGIAIIVQHFFPDFQVVDIVTAILCVLFWLLGLLFVSKDFAMKTLVATIVYPLTLSLFLRIPAIQDIATKIAGTGTTGDLMLCAIFGGVFTGAGVSITFIGGGSTGGVDVLIFILQKLIKIKESIISFLIDGLIIIIALIVSPDYLVNSLCGIITAFLSAVFIEFVYLGSQSSFQADIISDKYHEISKYVQEELGRGATIIDAYGGYKGDPRPILRVVFPKKQYELLKYKVHEIDPNAFITFTQTNAVYGEGFKELNPIIKFNKKSKNNEDLK